MTRLEQAKLLLDFYFAPWGAAKGEIWETVSGDEEFCERNMEDLVRAIINREYVLSGESIKLVKIVTG